ncbi:hypothetical protein MY04_3324 [Flammeovirga sp. MY04]|nr:hypothetical protein [Flammeovirga sp. MY04]ANQ50686.1 hypothetical protein MY04_3324 [Flammeovirga sp. MY04]
MTKKLIKLFSIVILLSIFSGCTEEETKPNSIIDNSGSLKVENINITYKNEDAGIDVVFTKEDNIASDILIEFKQVEGGTYGSTIKASDLDDYRIPVGKYNASFSRFNPDEYIDDSRKLHFLPIFSGTFDFEIKQDEITSIDLETSDSEGYAVTYDVPQDLINTFGSLELHVMQNISELKFDVEREKKIFFASSDDIGNTYKDGGSGFGVHLSTEIDDRPYYLSKIYIQREGTNHIHFSLSDFTNPTDGFSQKHSVLNFKEYVLASVSYDVYVSKELNSWDKNNDLSEFKNIKLDENGNIIFLAVSFLDNETTVDQSLPKSILNFPELETLVVNYSYGVKLWDEIGDLLPNLTHVSLAQTSVTLPESFYKLNLTYLDMEKVQFNDDIKSKILGFNNLEYLSFQYTETFPDVRHMKNLKALRLEGPYIWEDGAAPITIPSWIGELQQLEEFGLEDTRIYEFPVTMREMKNLKKVYLYSNDIKEFPDFIQYLPQLEEIVLSVNKIEGEFPLYLTEFQNLKYLNLANNKLSGPLPLEILNMSSLEKLDIIYNYFTEEDIPQELKNGDFEFLYFGQQVAE